MAGRGPAPKTPETRRNTTKPKAGEWILLPAEGYKGAIPSLKGLGFSKQTHQWWRTIWRSPMATQWSKADIPALLELAALRERLMDGKLSVAPEVRLRSEEFGLTPKGRQDRRWAITDEAAVQAGFSTTDELQAKRSERRSRLKQAVGEE